MDETSFAIATAFRGASEEDTRQILNAMSQSNLVGDLKFYVVPCSWMEECLPFLQGKVDKRPTEKIINEPMLSGAVSDDDDDENKGKRVPSQAAAAGSTNLRQDIVHQQDFFLVGANVWGLVSGKFGYDLQLECKASRLENNQLSIHVGDQMRVGVPASGRFAYETKKATDVVSEDDDDEIPYNRAFAKQPTNGDTKAAPSTENRIILRPSGNDPVANGPVRFTKTPPSNVHETAVLRKRKRYGSGLGNLGNTCFMNSTLQCLAHTEPLRRYFVSGDYEHDLNRDNPLGTGGELATQFADLLNEMFGAAASGSSYSFNSVVYPRNFKFTLGKHAEQFMGYDQHDSQELATYLLDALHEDTNRVTKKPYIEKPEQGEDEPDDEAARKAWRLHLQREDSRVLEHFMGQVKSRVECPKAGCGRVSTTFDPFMYLSVPIPGASERDLKLTFVPRGETALQMTVTVPKTGTFDAVLKKTIEQYKKHSKRVVSARDLVGADIWTNEVYAVYEPNVEVERIRDTDVTFIFELRTVDEIAEMQTTDETESEDEDDDDLLPSCAHLRSKIMPIDTESDLYKDGKDGLGQTWESLLGDYSKGGHMNSNRILNTKRSSMPEKINHYRQMEDFLQDLYRTREVLNYSNPAVSDTEDDEDSGLNHLTIDQVCRKSRAFVLATAEDVKLFEIVAYHFRQYVLTEKKRERDAKSKDGLVIQIVQREERMTARHGDSSLTHPMFLRIPENMSVYGLRKELSDILPLRTAAESDTIDGDTSGKQEENGDAVDMSLDVVPSDSDALDAHEAVNGDGPTVVGHSEVDPLDLMRTIPLTFEPASSSQNYSSTYHRGSFQRLQPLGMLQAPDDVGDPEDDNPVSLATEDDPSEQLLVSDIVGEGGVVHLNWTRELREKYFDLKAYEAAEEIEHLVRRTRHAQKATTVADCIEKYCQKEQLEDTEKWYCNECKEHVRAWKQFHLYRTPPILIVHLKRFQYSATTHRRDKIDSFIDFPLDGLDLTKEVMHWSDDEKPIYDCYAVSNHYGGLGGGHYTAYAMGDDGVWCHYDDSRVTTDVDAKDVVSAAAYVLYYKRRDVVFQTPEIELPVPAIVQDHTEKASASNLADVEDDSTPMDVDRNPIVPDGSPAGSQASTSPMGSVTNEIGSDDAYQGVYDSPTRNQDEEKEDDPEFFYSKTARQ